SNPSAQATSYEGADRVRDLARPQRQPAHAVVADGVHEELRAHELQQLSQVDLGNEHTLVPLQYVAGVARERIQILQVRVRDGAAVLTNPPHSRRDRPVSSA